MQTNNDVKLCLLVGAMHNFIKDLLKKLLSQTKYQTEGLWDRRWKGEDESNQLII